MLTCSPIDTLQSVLTIFDLRPTCMATKLLVDDGLTLPVVLTTDQIQLYAKIRPLYWCQNETFYSGLFYHPGKNFDFVLLLKYVLVIFTCYFTLIFALKLIAVEKMRE